MPITKLKKAGAEAAKKAKEKAKEKAEEKAKQIAKEKAKKSAATQKGMKFSKKKNITMAKDTPFAGLGIDAKPFSRVRGEDKEVVVGTVARTPSAGKVNVGDDIAAFNNFIKTMTEGGSKNSKRIRAFKTKMARIMATGTEKQAASAKNAIDRLNAKLDKYAQVATRQANVKRSQSMQGKTKPKDTFEQLTKDIAAAAKQKPDPESGNIEAFDKILNSKAFNDLPKNRQNILLRNFYARQKGDFKLAQYMDKAMEKLTTQGGPRKSLKYNKGGDLKPIPTGNKGKGLSMLPTSVRNNMGFMKQGGFMKKAFGSNDMRLNKGGLLMISIDHIKAKNANKKR